jgi:hypothetical protein
VVCCVAWNGLRLSCNGGEAVILAVHYGEWMWDGIPSSDRGM